MKLHLGCGCVYLDGYVNIDAIGEIASERPDLVEHNITTIDKYYKYPWRTNTNNIVCDRIMDIRNLDYPDESVDEILSVNLIDHMKKDDFIAMLQEWKRILKKSGQIVIDIDDRLAQAKELVEAKTLEETEWALKMIYCNHKNEFDTHWWGYTRDYLKELLENEGFVHKWTKDDYIIHDMYSNFQICVLKG